MSFPKKKPALVAGFFLVLSLVRLASTKRAVHLFRRGLWVGWALAPQTLSGECPPASACGRHLLLYFASKGMGGQRPTHPQAPEKPGVPLLTARRAP